MYISSRPITLELYLNDDEINLLEVNNRVILQLLEFIFGDGS